MAELNFDILGEQGEVSAATFRESVYYATYLLREFDSAISGKPHGVLGWYIQHLQSNGKLSVVFRSKLKPSLSVKHFPQDVDRAVTASFVTGFEDIEVKCVTPAYLSEYALQKVEKLAHLIGKNGARGFHFETQSKGIEVTKRTTENIGKLLPIRRTAIGSAEGTLEVVNIHKHPRFIVYHAVTKKAVTCEFKEASMGKVKDSLGKRVAVFGTLYKNINGDTLRVAMDRLEILDDVRRFILPTTEDLNDPEFAKIRSTEEYLRNIRGR